MKTFLTLLVLAVAIFQVQGQSHEDRLVDQLLRRLGKTGPIARPLVLGKESDPVDVSLGLALLRLASLKDSSAEMDVWIQMFWKDPRLSWDPEDFGGLSKVTLPSDLLWIPDVRPFHAGKYMPDRVSPIRVVVMNTSDIIYVLPAKLRAPCDRLSKKSIKCRPVLGSWVYSGYELNTTLSSKAFSLDDFEPLSGWSVASATADRVETYYDCCPEPYISVRYSLVLNKKRSPKGGEGGKGKDKRRREEDEDEDDD